MHEALDGLTDAWREVEQLKAEIDGLWLDSVRQGFDKEYWAPVGEEVRRTLAETREVAEALAGIEREMSGDGE